MRRSPQFEAVMDEPDVLPAAAAGAVVPFFLDRQQSATPATSPAVGLSPELKAEIIRVFGAAVLADRDKVQAIVGVAREFQHQGRKVLQAAVQMGRSLVVLQQAIGLREMARGMRDSRVIFCGWSAGNLSKMMRVAAFVDAGGYSLDTLPQNWSNAYELTTLSEAEFEQARLGGLVRPDVTRSQLHDFKRSLPPSAGRVVDPSRSADQLKASIREARQRRRRIEAQAKELDDRIAGLEAQLDAIQAGAPAEHRGRGRKRLAVA